MRLSIIVIVVLAVGIGRRLFSGDLSMSPAAIVPPWSERSPISLMTR
jgi:hypothetical protein